MTYNKFIKQDGTVLLDLTKDTVTAGKLAKGETAHGADGEPIVGTAELGKPSDIVDVTKLPTEGIEQDKIYRVAGGDKDAYEVWFKLHPDELYMYPGLTNPVNMLDLNKYSSCGKCVTSIHIVDSLPEVGEVDYYYDSVTDTTYNNVYFIAGDDTYVGYWYYDYGYGDCGWSTIADSDLGPYLGTITDPSQIDTTSENYGYYIINRKISTPTVYGIPDEGDNKTVFEYKSEGGWKDDACGLKDVKELPTEGIEQDTVYRVTKKTSKEVTEIWIVMNEPRDWYTTNPINLHYLDCCNFNDPLAKTNIHVVDSLPEYGEPQYYWDSVTNTNVFNYYVIDGDPSSPAYYYNGRWFTFTESGDFGQYRGTVTDLADVTEEGYYIVKRPVYEECYGIPDESNKRVFEHSTKEGWMEISSVEPFVEDAVREVELNLPNAVVIRNYAFYMCYKTKITAIKAPKLLAINPSAFQYCASATFTSLPDTVMYIGTEAFNTCEGLTTLSLPKSLQTVERRAFGWCANLTEVTFNSYVYEMTNDVFASCNNLTTINVPWSEGEVANAPWGATNATINYNCYVEE